MADVSGHQFKRNSFDLITESLPWHEYIFGNNWHEDGYMFLTIGMRMYFWPLTWGYILDSWQYTSRIYLENWRKELLLELTIGNVVSPVGWTGIHSRRRRTWKYAKTVIQTKPPLRCFFIFTILSSIKPAGILAILILHSEVFEKTVVVALVLLPVLLNYDLAVLKIEWVFFATFILASFTLMMKMA